MASIDLKVDLAALENQNHANITYFRNIEIKYTYDLKWVLNNPKATLVIVQPFSFSSSSRLCIDTKFSTWNTKFSTCTVYRCLHLAYTCDTLLLQYTFKTNSGTAKFSEFGNCSRIVPEIRTPIRHILIYLSLSDQY